ncbi:MAG: hypothetical protein QW797_08030 [Thermoproteota archaeon]
MPQDAIHNYALMYALWNKARFAAGYKAHYLTDLQKMDYYATPAHPVGKPDLKDWIGSRPTHFDRVKITYNSISELAAIRMGKVQTNIPAQSSYYKFPPLTCYEFYLISKEEPKNLIRIGKKFIPARLQVQKLKKCLLRNGRHSPCHLVNMADLPSGAKIQECTIMFGFPTPLMAHVVVESEFIEACDNCGQRITVQTPNREIYKSLPDLNILVQK